MKGLEAVRDRHLREAEAHAASLVQDARAQAREVIEKAQAEAAALTSQAEREGRESADQDTSREWVAARRRAREIKLAAQRNAFDELKNATVSEVESDGRSRSLLARMGDAARRRLGPGAEVTIEGRSVSASRKHRHVTWTLEGHIDECLRMLGPQIVGLWR